MNQNQGYRGNESASHSPPYINHNQMYRPNDANQGPPPSGNQNQGYRGNDHSPPYTNIGAVTQNRPHQPAEPRPSAHQRLFGNQGGSQAGGNVPKVSQSNQQRQPNFYENTHPATQEAAPPFHQLQRPPSESDKPKPAVMPKPAVAKKPGPKVQPADIPLKTVDNRQSQPGFYGNRPSPQPQPGGPQQYVHGYPDSRSPHDSADRLDARGMHQDPRAMPTQDPRNVQDPRYMQQPQDHSLSSAWDREEREKAAEQQAEELYRAREAEIMDLESRSYLSIQDQERLRKLKLEHEFQRRVREIDEKGDYEADDDDEAMERLFTRERLIQSLKEDLDKSRQRSQDLHRRQMIQDAQHEKERIQRLERRLEMMEKDRQEMHERMEKRQQRRARDHQEQLRQQREAREKQRQNYEEQKRLLLMEEEKIRQRREEEINKRRNMERERLQEMQIARDNEEARLRAEVRRQNDDYVTQQMLQQRQQRIDQNREIRVAEERRRLDAMGGGAQNAGSVSLPPVSTGHLNNGLGGGGKTGPGYQQYMNLPPPQQQILEKENLAPPPPERKSSYSTAAATRNNLDYTSLPFQPPQQQQQQQPQQHQLPPALTKKSVKFNTDMNTYQDRTPSHSFSSEHNMSPSTEQVTTGPNEVFQSPASRPPAAAATSPGTMRQDSTPTVIGAQEVYRDPRNRIEAQKAAQAPVRKQANERMSFRDKMKYFAAEAGEETIKYKPKASKTLRNIESQLNGQ
nr:hypothetical protein BaRGS_018778 [Batillaria attramentaria]